MVLDLLIVSSDLVGSDSSELGEVVGVDSVASNTDERNVVRVLADVAGNNSLQLST